MTHSRTVQIGLDLIHTLALVSLKRIPLSHIKNTVSDSCGLEASSVLGWEKELFPHIRKKFKTQEPETRFAGEELQMSPYPRANKENDIWGRRGRGGE